MFQVLFPLCTCAIAYGFLTENTNNNVNPDVLKDVLELMVDEKNLRHQLEQVVTQMKTELDELKQNQSTEMQNLQHENQYLKSVVSSLQQKVNSTSIATNAMKSELRNLQQAQQHQESCSTACNSNTSSQNIGFTARLLSTSTITSESLLNFSKIIYRTDNSFNNGVFTCPRKGLYMFSLSVLLFSPSSQGAWIELLKNDKFIMFVSTGPSAHDRGSSTAVLNLNFGDRISVKTQSTYYYRHESYFSGVLISAY